MAANLGDLHFTSVTSKDPILKPMHHIERLWESALFNIGICFYPLLHLFSCVCLCMCRSTRVEVRGRHPIRLGSVRCVHCRNKLWSSDLVARAFTHWAIPTPQPWEFFSSFC